MVSSSVIDMQKPIPLSYGADASGLICCYAFRPDGSRLLDSSALIPIHQNMLTFLHA
jgi:hypothetical protein